MMPNIFLSWSSPDRARVLPLRDRLRSVGLRVWEYSEDMPGGANIHQDIIKTINQVQMAVICFSDATAEREWIVNESNWVLKTFYDGDRALRHIIPVNVGPKQKDKVPKVLKDTNFRAINVSIDNEESIARLVIDIFKQLDRNAPLVIPAALFAMTRKQCTALLNKKETEKKIVAVCTAAGMKAPPAIKNTLLARYGAAPEDLAPFGPGPSFRQIVDSVLARANGARAAAMKRPVFLRWMRDELVGPARVDALRSQWASGSSLLIVDSVSAFHEQIQKQLSDLPEAKRPERASLFWLPPYTQHTAALEQVLGPAAAIVAKLGDAFRDWRDEPPARAMAFDTATPAAAKRWLHDALVSVDDEPEPIADNVSSMERALTTRYPGGKLLPGSAKGGAS